MYIVVAAPQIMGADLKDGTKKFLYTAFRARKSPVSYRSADYIYWKQTSPASIYRERTGSGTRPSGKNKSVNLRCFLRLRRRFSLSELT